MNRRQIQIAILTMILIPFLRAVPAFAIGDRVVPHVVDGGDAGLRYRTKFDITNISYFLNSTITNVTVNFFKDDGSSWTVSIKDPVTGNTVNTSSYRLNLGTSQTVRIETLGTGSFASGFAIISNLEATTDLPDQFETAITVFYEVLQNGNIIDTVSVPVGQPTMSFTFPVEIDKTRNPALLTGFAIVNLTGSPNIVAIDLYENTSPMSGNAQKYNSQPAQIVLSSAQTGKKTARFLDETSLFPNITKFKGMAVATSQGAVSILALLQTPTTTGGVQYATLVPAYLDALRRNTIAYLQQGYSLDADLGIVDYFRGETNPDAYYEQPWDVLYESANGGQVTPLGNAMVSVLGQKTVDQFDALSISDLQSKVYSTNTISMNTNSGNRQEGFSFAIKTGLGRYAKARIRTVISYSDGTYALALELYVYK